MIFVSYTKTDTYYEFVGENGQKLLYPVSSIILTDDESVNTYKEEWSDYADIITAIPNS